MIKKICVVTSSRADFGQLYWLIDRINKDSQLTLQLVVTGSHLSSDFGNTVLEISHSGFKIEREIDIQISSDSPVSVCKSMGLAQIYFAKAFEELSPDVVIILGDRSEMLTIASSALIMGIPIAHLHGGEITEGAYDDSIRHAITKMSSLHFTSTDIYRRRVIQMGENPDTVFNVGALAIESVLNLKLLDRKEFEESIQTKLMERNFLITFHPTTTDSLQTTEAHINELLKALDRYDRTKFIFTYPNSDKNGAIIREKLEEYVLKNVNKAVIFKSLGQIRYLSALKHVDLVIGNSSSGILEAPALNTPTVNIGDRQKGRILGPTIFNCQPEREAICNAIDKAFIVNTEAWKHPYGDGNTSSRILEILKSVDEIRTRKIFFDIPLNNETIG